MFDDATAFAAVVAGMVESWRDQRVDKVCAIEARGFILGGAVAHALGAGFVAIRKEGNLFPGPKHRVVAAPDYRGTAHVLQVQQQSINAGDRCLLVDDWIERASQARAACELISACGGDAVGIAVIVDQLGVDHPGGLPPVTRVVTASELPSA